MVWVHSFVLPLFIDSVKLKLVFSVSVSKNRIRFCETKNCFLFCLNFDSKFDSKVSNEPGSLHTRFYILVVYVGLVLAFCVIGEICSQQTAHVGLLPAMWYVELSTALYLSLMSLVRS